MTFSSLYEKYLKYRAFKGGSERTDGNYKLAYKQFVTYLANRALKDDVRNFTAENVEGFAQAFHAGGMKGSSIGTKLAALSSLGTYATRPGVDVLQFNPADKRVERPKRLRPAEKYLFKHEVEALLAVDCMPTERLALLLLLDTNVRASELVNAKVKNLSLDGERVVLAITVKGGQPETVELGEDVAKMLLDSLKLREAGPDEALIVSSANHAYTRTSLSEMVAKLAKRAGITRIPVRAHLLARHTPASHLGQDGASVFEIAALLRHKDTSTASKYVHGVDARVARERLREMRKGGQ